MTLKRKTFSAIRWTITAAVARAVLQIGQLAILARLLSPEDYGLMAMVTAILVFGNIFTDLGVNSAFVQRREISAEQRSSLFWLNVLASGGIAALTISISPLLADFFDDRRLMPLIMLSSGTFLFSAFGQQLKMSAQKELDFRPVVLIEISSSVFGFVFAVAAALAGWGVYALIVSAIIYSLAGTVFAWIFLSKGWRPLPRLRRDDVQPFLGFGSALVANNIVNHINSVVDLFLGGRLLNATQLGYYSVPRNLTLQLQMMVNPIVTRVGFPLIAHVQNDVVKVRAIFLKSINMTASANAPIYLGIAFFAPEVVTVLLGSGWEPSEDLLRLFALWGGLRALGNPAGSLLLGMGRAGLALKWNLGLMVAVPAALFVGVKAGAEGMAWSLLVLQIILLVPAWYVLVRPICGSGLREYLTFAFKPYLLAGVAVFPAYLLTAQMDDAIPRLILGATLAVPLYVGISVRGNPEWFRAMMELAGRS